MASTCIQLCHRRPVYVLLAACMLLFMSVPCHGSGQNRSEGEAISAGARLAYFKDAGQAYDNTTSICFYGVARPIISQAANRVFFYLQVDISFGGPCGTILPPSPPPASRGANATAPPARSILLDLSNPLLRLDESAVYQSLWVTGYPLRGQGLRTSTLYVTVLRPGALASGGGYDAVVPTLARSDTGEPPLRLKVGAAMVVINDVTGVQYQPRLYASEMEQLLASKSEANTIAQFLKECSFGEVELESDPEQELSASVSIQGASLEELASRYGVGLPTAVCLSSIMMDIRGQLEAELSRMGGYVGSVDSRRWTYMLTALPDRVYELAVDTCGKLDPDGRRPGSSVLQLATAFNCRNDGSLCASLMTQMSADAQLSQAAIRGLGHNFGLIEFQPRRVYGMVHDVDPTSGLAASGACFNGPQSWLLGWMEVPEELDLFFDVSDLQAALSQVERRALPAYGTSKEAIMRVRLDPREGDREAPPAAGAAYRTTFWVVFRTTSPDIHPHFCVDAKPQLALYEMNHRRGAVASASNSPILWGLTCGANSGQPAVYAPVIRADRMFDEGDYASKADAFLRVDAGRLRRDDLQAHVTVCVVRSVGDPCAT